MQSESARAALQKLAELYPELPPQLRQAADFVLEKPVDVALLSIRKAAAKAGVAPSTLTRLAKTLGFERYDAFRRLFQRQVKRQSATGFGQRAQSLQERARRDPDSERLFSLASAAFRNLDQLLQPAIQEQLRQAACRLLRARHIYALGFRDAHAAAHHFAYMARVAFPHCELLRGMAGMLLTELATIGRDDVVVVFGSDPYTRETVDALDVIRQSGAEVIAVTDSLRSPLARGAAQVFCLSGDSPLFFPSLLPAIALTEALVAECIGLGDQTMLENIETFETNLRRLGGYR